MDINSIIRFGLELLGLTMLFYLLLATGVAVIANFAPVPRKPLLNVCMLAVVILGFIFTLVRLWV